MFLNINSSMSVSLEMQLHSNIPIRVGRTTHEEHFIPSMLEPIWRGETDMSLQLKYLHGSDIWLTSCKQRCSLYNSCFIACHASLLIIVICSSLGKEVPCQDEPSDLVLMEDGCPATVFVFKHTWWKLTCTCNSNTFRAILGHHLLKMFCSGGIWVRYWFLPFMGDTLLMMVAKHVTSRGIWVRCWGETDVPLWYPQKQRVWRPLSMVYPTWRGETNIPLTCSEERNRWPWTLASMKGRNQRPKEVRVRMRVGKEDRYIFGVRVDCMFAYTSMMFLNSTAFFDVLSMFLYWFRHLDRPYHLNPGKHPSL
jgi:hypothetical protein